MISRGKITLTDDVHNENVLTPFYVCFNRSGHFVHVCILQKIGKDVRLRFDLG